MATGSYDANGIWQYGEDDNIALFSDLLNLATESTSDAFTDDRARLATLEAGSNAGLIPIKPTSVDKAGSGSTAAISTLGSVTFTSCTSISLNGLFNTTYKNYLVILSSPTSTVDAVDTRFVYRASGANITSAGYFYEGVNITGAGSVTGEYTAGNTSTGLGLLEPTGPGRGSAIMEFIAPYTTDQKIMFTKLSRANQFQNRGHLFTGTSQYDGFTLYPASGSFSGVLTAYGYR